MNTNTLQGQWLQLRGKIKEKWGKLTNDDLDVIEGKRDQLVGRIQSLYGQSRDEVDRAVREFEQDCGCR